MELNDETIKKYEYLVKMNARETKTRYFEVDDLVSFGYIGLMKAINNYNQNCNCTFEKWADYCIKMAIYDGMRKEGPFKRKKMENIVEKENEMMTKEQFQTLQLLSITHAESYELFSETCEIGIMDNQLEQAELYELNAIIQKMCSSLTKREKQVLFLKFYKEYKSKEISNILGLTESRIFQLQKNALKKLKTPKNRKKLEDYL